ncbi:DUF4430 domain-containing protein [Bacillus sp. PS06]|uniref:DUF4430 domain-containing protein n=1 Tax=Bacillus sp. PS06 TaxID=2764176 RepID=UPI001781B2BD|nr:DUF4430 domain-containing protein [Bacillus sp. PS06]MBD8070299.1 DUF4430 domain-containing protein [Bacillus sp. PS06]
MSKKIVASYIAFLLIFVQLIVPFQVQVFANSTNVASVVVEGKGGEVLDQGEVTIQIGDTALTLLKNLVGEEYIEVSETNWGPSLDTIHGLTSIDTFYYWAFYVNDEFMSVGSSDYIVKENDQIRFSYTSWAEATVSVEINKEKVVEKKTISIEDNTSIIDGLILALGEENVKYEVHETYGPYITEINGIKPEGTYYWALYLNGEYAVDFRYDDLLNLSDHLELRYISWEDPLDDESTEDTNDQETLVPTPADPNTVDIDKLNKNIKDKLTSTNAFIQNSKVNTAWKAIAASQYNGSFSTDYINYERQQLKDRDGIFRNVTDYERITLGLVASGIDPTNIDGFNLIERIYNNERMENQGLNGPIYALISLDSKDFEVPSSALWTREQLVSILLKAQNSDGGFGLYSGASDVDITAMALTALSNYQQEERVQQAINKGILWLSSKQNENGGFTGLNGESSVTTAEVIIALSALKVSPNESTLFSGALAHLLKFGLTSGEFSNYLGDAADAMATEKAYLALVAYHQFLLGKGSIYDFSATAVVDPPQEEQVVQGPEETGDTQIEEDQIVEVERENNKESTKEVDGYKLPNTATNVYNFLVLGLVLMVIGLIVYTFANKRKMA